MCWTKIPKTFVPSVDAEYWEEIYEEYPNEVDDVIKWMEELKLEESKLV